MRNRIVLMAAALALVAAVHAQSTSTPQALKSDSWSTKNKPTTASKSLPLAESDEFSQAGNKDDDDKSSFKFKDGQAKGPMSQPAPSAHDQAAVMGEDRGWQGGRPPANCAMTPHDASCH